MNSSNECINLLKKNNSPLESFFCFLEGSSNINELKIQRNIPLD